MKLNHIDIPVADVEANVAFLQRYFELQRPASKASAHITILTDRQGFVLVLQRRKNAAESHPTGFHIGFALETREQVYELQARARADGVVVSDVIENGRGTLVYVTAPDGYFVEATHPPERDAPRQP
jgi:catechol 2,3-dioxygenase-like lactoylglutathione lyase family enzyme